jgi:hypothetical protein
MDGLIEASHEAPRESPRARREREADEADSRAFAAMNDEDLGSAERWYRALAQVAKSTDRRWGYERLAAMANVEQGRRVTRTWGND